MGKHQTNIPLSELPDSWQETFRQLRYENAKLRIQRNQARDALQALALQLAK